MTESLFSKEIVTISKSSSRMTEIMKIIVPLPTDSAEEAFFTNVIIDPSSTLSMCQYINPSTHNGSLFLKPTSISSATTKASATPLICLNPFPLPPISNVY